MYDLIVVGGGPAGLTATIFALRKRINVLLVSTNLGGMTNYHLELPWIEPHTANPGLEVVKKFKSELEYLDFARHMEPVEKICHHKNGNGDGFAVLTRGGGELVARAVIVASGTQQRRLEISGEKEYLGHGMGYSAISYAPQFIDRTALVIGEGDLALRAAAELATVAKHVHLVKSSAARGQSPLESKLRKARNVTVMDGCQVAAVKGDGTYARSVMVKDAKGKETEVTIDGAFIEQGLLPNSQMVVGLVELDEQGRIIVDANNRTNIPGIFAAGDVTNSYAEQVLIALGDGAKAALSAYEYLLPML